MIIGNFRFNDIGLGFDLALKYGCVLGVVVKSKFHMNIDLLAILVTLVLGVAGFVVNSFIQRRNNSIKVIVQHRLERRQRTLEKLSVLIKLSDRAYLSMVLGLIDATSIKVDLEGKDHSECSSERSEAIRQVVEACASIRSMYGGSYPCDRDLIRVLDSFKRSFARCIQSGCFDSELETSRDILIKIIDVYCTTEWRRIKNETVGKKRASSDAWIQTFKQIEEMYEENMEG